MLHKRPRQHFFFIHTKNVFYSVTNIAEKHLKERSMWNYFLPKVLHRIIHNDALAARELAVFVIFSYYNVDKRKASSFSFNLC